MHNRPFNNGFPWLPSSFLKDEPPFILKFRGQLQFIFGWILMRKIPVGVNNVKILQV